jgi:threonine/homoserine/homoserine lactone efflux protein
MQGMVLGGIHASIAAVWYGSIVASIDTVSQWLRRPGPWRWVQSISGVALVLLGARLMVSKGLQASP